MGWILAKQIIMWDGQLPWMPGEVQYSIISSARTLEPALYLNLSWPWNKPLNVLEFPFPNLSIGMSPTTTWVFGVNVHEVFINTGT